MSRLDAVAQRILAAGLVLYLCLSALASCEKHRLSLEVKTLELNDKKYQYILQEKRYGGEANTIP